MQHFSPSDARIAWITGADDFTTTTGFTKAPTAVRDPEAGHIIVWLSIPCAWGSLARNLDSTNKAQYIAWSIKHWELLEALSQGALAVVHEALGPEGGLIIERPRPNFLWNFRAMQQLCAQYAITPIDIYESFQSNSNNLILFYFIGVCGSSICHMLFYWYPYSFVILPINSY